MTNYLLILVTILVFVTAEPLLPYEEPIFLTDKYKEKDGNGIKTIPGFSYNILSFNEHSTAAEGPQKNSFIEAWNGIKNHHRKSNKSCHALQAYVNQCYAINSQGIIITIWQWYFGLKKYLKVMLLFAFVGLLIEIKRLEEREIKIIKSKTFVLLNLSMIYVCFFLPNKNNLCASFTLLFLFAFLCISCIRQYFQRLDDKNFKQMQKMQIVFKITSSNQKDKKILREEISAIDLMKQIDDVCSICLDSFSYQNIKKRSTKYQPVVVKISCNHYFHLDCIKELINSGIGVCPLDKSPILYN